MPGTDTGVKDSNDQPVYAGQKVMVYGNVGVVEKQDGKWGFRIDYDQHFTPFDQIPKKDIKRTPS